MHICAFIFLKAEIYFGIGLKFTLLLINQTNSVFHDSQHALIVNRPRSGSEVSFYIISNEIHNKTELRSNFNANTYLHAPHSGGR